MTTKILVLTTLVVICGVGAHSFAAGEGKEAEAAPAATRGKAGKEAEAGGKSEKTSEDKEPGSNKESKDGGKSQSADEHGLQPAHPGCPVCPVRSPAELDVLMTLRERNAEIDTREALVQRREHAVAEMEKTFDAMLTKLDAKVAQLEKRLDMGEPGRLEKEKRITTLVETLSGLTPKKASPILSETDPEVAAELLRRMDASKVAALLTIMPASKAGEFITLGVGKPRPKGASAQDAGAPKAPEATP